MPIFEGDQGLGKTTFLQLLCPKPEWFAGDMRLDEEPKRLYQLMQGRLIIEFAELSGKRKTDIDKVKAFLSQQQDSFVANYDKRKTTYPRIACCAGSTNEMNYLRDTTGNRRFPPLIVTKKLDWNALLAEKEQLWAEAVWLEAMGDMFYEQLTLPDKCFRILEPVQEDRLDVDVQVLDILNELDAFETPFVQDETIWQRIGIYQDRRHERNRHRFTMDQIKNLLQRRGWKVKDVGWVDGKSKKGHFKHKKGISLREIVYANGKFMYLSTLTKEQEGILE
jgi:predicted P-loop ATPase